MDYATYSEHMDRTDAFLTLRIDTKNPIEIRDFVGAFTSLAEEYKRFSRVSENLLPEDAKIYVTEVRKGSIEADLLPIIVSAFPLLATHASNALAIEEFVKLWGGRIRKVIHGTFPDSETSSNAKHWMDTVSAIARDPMGTATLTAATFEDGKRKERYSFSFETQQAQEALKTIDGVYERIEKKSQAEHERVMMIFTRSDVGNAKIGKPSGERVKIEGISEKSLALMYASEIAEEKIKYEIREAQDNIYKKGFVVDVNVQHRGQQPVAYAVKHVHDIIDLPEAED